MAKKCLFNLQLRMESGVTTWIVLCTNRHPVSCTRSRSHINIHNNRPGRKGDQEERKRYEENVLVEFVPEMWIHFKYFDEKIKK